MRRMACVVILALLCGVLAPELWVGRSRYVSASGYTKMPDPGKLARTIPFRCGEQDVERRFYDFVLEDEDNWKSLGIGLPGERNFVLLVFLPEHAVDAVDSKVYVDANRNGWAEEVIAYDEAVERWEGSWCTAYEKVRKGKP